MERPRHARGVTGPPGPKGATSGDDHDRAGHPRRGVAGDGTAELQAGLWDVDVDGGRLAGIDDGRAAPLGREVVRDLAGVSELDRVGAGLVHGELVGLEPDVEAGDRERPIERSFPSPDPLMAWARPE